MANGELISNDRPPVEAVQAALRVWFRTEQVQPHTCTRVYYDTFDGLVRGADRVVWQEGGIYHVADLEGSEEPRLRAAQTIAELTGIRALIPQAEVETRTQTVNVLDGLEKTIARVNIETSTVIVQPAAGTDAEPDANGPLEADELQPGDVQRQPDIQPQADVQRQPDVQPRAHVQPPAAGPLQSAPPTLIELPARIRVTGLRGYDRELGKVRELLERSDELRAAPEPLIDEAVRASGGTPGGVNISVAVRMSPDERGDVVVARVLRRQLLIMDLNLAGTIANTDTEFLHDYRVAVRRSRSVLKEMPGVFSPDDLEYVRTELRWLQEVTGPTRDLDVWMLEFDELTEVLPAETREHLEPLKLVIGRRHEQARAEMDRQLESTRANELHDWWAGLLEVLVLEDESDRPDANTPITELASARIRKVHRRMVKMGRAIGPDTDPHDYHQLRKRGKELRYLLELFGTPLYDPEVVKPMVKALKGLQDVLGRHQDRDVQVHVLKQLAPEVMREPDGAQALMTLGVLVQQLEADAAQARSEFAASFETFAAPAQLELVHDTFRA